MCAPISELLTIKINMVSLGVEIAESLEVANREPGTDTSSHIRWEIPYLYVRLCLALNIFLPFSLYLYLYLFMSLSLLHPILSYPPLFISLCVCLCLSLCLLLYIPLCITLHLSSIYSFRIFIVGLDKGVRSVYPFRFGYKPAKNL